MKEVLNVDKKPYINHLPDDTFPFVVLGSRKYAQEWLCVNFLYLAIDKRDNLERLSLDASHRIATPFYKICRIPYEILALQKADFLDLIKISISKGYYVSISVNMSSISNYKYDLALKQKHQIHIYGYDDGSNTYNVFDFFQDKLTFATCPYTEVANGYYECPYPHVEKIELYKLHYFSDDTYYCISTARIIEILTELLNSENSRLKHAAIINDEIKNEEKEFCCGMDFYSYILSVIKNSEVMTFPNRTMYTVYAHCKLLFKLIEILSQKNNINFSDAFMKINSLLSKTKLLMNVYIKCSIKNSILSCDDRLKMCSLISEIKNNEEELLLLLIKSIAKI